MNNMKIDYLPNWEVNSSFLYNDSWEMASSEKSVGGKMEEEYPDK